MTTTRLFYQRGLMTHSITEKEQRALLRVGHTPLAENAQHSGKNQTSLLAADEKNSVLKVHKSEQKSPTYTPYGYKHAPIREHALLAFNGEYQDPVTHHYLLGSYRLYSTTLMRFHSADSLSPFEEGGINSYAYCSGNPIDFSDPTGSIKAPKPLQLSNNQQLRRPPATRQQARRWARENRDVARDVFQEAGRNIDLSIEHRIEMNNARSPADRDAHMNASIQYDERSNELLSLNSQLLRESENLMHMASTRRAERENLMPLPPQPEGTNTAGQRQVIDTNNNRIRGAR